MKQKIIYLHVGTSKTGTTSIQCFLNDNHLLLKQYNFTAFIPDPNLFQRVNKTKDLSETHKLINIVKLIRQRASTGVNNWSYPQRQFLNSFIKSIKECKSDNVILSEELLWNISSDPKFRNIFSEIINELLQFSDIKVIVYLRRQDLFLMSTYQQRLRIARTNICGKNCQEWVESLIKSPNAISNYEETLKYLLSHFNKINVIVRPFETNQLLEQSLIKDFSNFVGLNITDEFVLPSKRSNPGLSPGLAEILRILSIYNYPIDTITSHLKSENMTNYQLFKNHEQYDFLSPKQRAAILERYASGNQWIAKEFLGREDGMLFKEPPPDIQEPWKPYKLDPEAVRTFFSNADFLEGKQRAILQKRVLHVLAHPFSAKSTLFQRKIRRAIRNIPRKFYTPLRNRKH